MIELGINWKGIRVILMLEENQEIYMGSLKALDIDHNRIKRAYIKLGIKNLNTRATKFLFAILFHELGHLDFFREIIEKYGVEVYNAVRSKVAGFFYDRKARQRIEVDASLRAVKFLERAGLLDRETFTFLCLALATYFTTSDREKEKLFKILSVFPFQSHQIIGDKYE